jgi:AcrR family transcriptional regulator
LNAAPGARPQILEAAARLLASIGYRATTLRGVAAAVGLQAGSLYHHFTSKDALVSEVMDLGVRVVRDAVAAAVADLPPDTPPRERLARAIEAHLRASLEHSAFTSAAIKSYGFVPPAIREANRRLRREYEDLWRAIVADLARAGALPPDISQESVRLMLLGAMNWAGEWHRADMDLARIARDFAGLTIRESAPAAARGPSASA